jgi:hypothetical protein
MGRKFSAAGGKVSIPKWTSHSPKNIFNGLKNPTAMKVFDLESKFGVVKAEPCLQKIYCHLHSTAAILPIILLF